MQCPSCKSEHIREDTNTNSWFCEDCKSIFMEPLIEKKIPIFVNVLINILLHVPLLNIPILALVNKFRIKEEYKSTYTAIVLYFNFVMLILLLLFSINVKNVRQVFSLLEEDTILHMAAEDFVEYQYLVDSLIQYEEELEAEPVSPEDKQDNGSKPIYIYKTPEDAITLDFLNNSIISGSAVLSILDKFPDLAVVLQTDKMRTKYGDDYYANYVRALSCCEVSDLYETQTLTLKKTYLKSLQNITTDLSYESLDNELITDNTKYISYIYENHRFEMYLIKDKNKDVIGVLFKEVGDKD